MAHAITVRKNGQAEMAYVGEKPWTSLGNELQRGATIEQWQTAAGMDWRIERSKVRYAIDARGLPSDFRSVDDLHVFMRSDTKDFLGTGSDKFKLVQPKAVLEFFRDLVAEAGYELETAGTLFGGRKFWAQASMNMQDCVGKGDNVRAKLLLATACDGTMRTVAKEVVERVVCANTLRMALDEGGKQRVVSHRSVLDPAQLKASMGIASKSFHAFIKHARELTKVQVSRERADALTLELLDADGANVELVTKTRESKTYQSVLRLFDGVAMGSNLPGVHGTAWGWLNAVTEHVDHHYGNAKTTADTRVDSAWFGPGDKLKTKALELVTVEK